MTKEVILILRPEGVAESSEFWDGLIAALKVHGPEYYSEMLDGLYTAETDDYGDITFYWGNVAPTNKPVLAAINTYCKYQGLQCTHMRSTTVEAET